jgi:predicted neuraminidase
LWINPLRTRGPSAAYRHPGVLTVLAFLPLCLGPVVPSIAQTDTPRLLSRSQVFSYGKSDPYDATNDYGFNHAPSIARLADGRLLAAWFSGPYEASVHQVILGSFSEDGGDNWGPAAVLQDEATRSDFDPAFITKGGRAWLFYTVGRWNRYPFVGLREAEKREVGVNSYRLLTRVSQDSGATWSQARQVLEDTGWGSRSNGLTLANGDLVLPIYHFEPPYTSAVLVSTDDGANWRRFGEIRTPGKTGAGEPTIAQLPDGGLVMALRTYDGRLWICHSSDRGRSWSKPRQTDLPATSSSHHLMCTSGGLLVLTHNPSEPPARSPLTLRTSRDAGRTWGEPLILDQVDPADQSQGIWSRQVCYPSAVELNDGTLAVVWARLELSNRHQSGVIYAARVSVE